MHYRLDRHAKEHAKERRKKKCGRGINLKPIALLVDLNVKLGYFRLIILYSDRSLIGFKIKAPPSTEGEKPFITAFFKI